MKGLEGFELISPTPAHIVTAEAMARTVHSEDYLARLRPGISEYALASAGSAICSAELAMKREKSFAITNPPGHHAGRSKAWGFCYLNNMAIAVHYMLRYLKKIIVIDLDMHLGDGTEALLGRTGAVYYHPTHGHRQGYVRELLFFLRMQQGDALAISAGFDNGLFEWGNLLTAEDYHTLGKELSWFADYKCRGRMFTILEGGYNQNVLPRHVAAFAKGIS